MSSINIFLLATELFVHAPKGRSSLAVASQELHGIEFLVEERAGYSFFADRMPSHYSYYQFHCMFHLNVRGERWY